MSKQPSTPPTPVPAASVVILRDTAGGLEVFMLERHQAQGVAFAGAFVFPGGKVDAEDQADEWAALAPGVAAVPPRGFWVAAVRETFEEAGLLIARSEGRPSLVNAALAGPLVAAERGADRKGHSARFAGMIAREGLHLAVDQMIHFGHWITPIWAPRRFDTHFFLTAAPVEQGEILDKRESAEGVWLRPQEALRQADAGERTLVAVTRCTLELLATWSGVDEALRAARARKVVTVQPYIEETPHGRMLRLPKDAGYPRWELPATRGG